MRRHLPLLATLFLTAFAQAQTAGKLTDEEKTRLLNEARALHQEADTIRAEAERRHSATQRECWEKFLVSACLDDAKKALRADTDRARGLDKQGRDLERDVKRREAAEREARRIEELPAREARAAERAEKNRQAMEEVQQRVERKQAEPAK